MGGSIPHRAGGWYAWAHVKTSEPDTARLSLATPFTSSVNGAAAYIDFLKKAFDAVETAAVIRGPAAS